MWVFFFGSTYFFVYVGYNHGKGGEKMDEKKSLRDELFPDGPPSPEEFIITVAKYIREQLGMDDNGNDLDLIH